MSGIDRSAAARAAARLGSALAGRLGLELVLAPAVTSGPPMAQPRHVLTREAAANHLLHRTCRPLVVCPGQRSAWPVLVADSAWGSW